MASLSDLLAASYSVTDTGSTVGAVVGSGTGVAVGGLGIDVEVAVGAGADVGIGRAVAVGFRVAVGLGVAVSGIGRAVAVGFRVAVALGVAVSGIGRAVAVGFRVAVASGVASAVTSPTAGEVGSWDTAAGSPSVSQATSTTAHSRARLPIVTYRKGSSHWVQAAYGTRLRLRLHVKGADPVAILQFVSSGVLD